MEKQKIKSVETMSNPKGCMVETYEGQKGSCWDVGYNTILKDCIEQYVMISFQLNPKGYNTVVELCPMEQGAVDKPQQTSKAEVVKNVNKTLSFEDTKQLSIEAQCVMKCATELVAGTISDSETYEDTGKHLAGYVDQLTGALLLAKHNLQCGK